MRTRGSTRPLVGSSMPALLCLAFVLAGTSGGVGRALATRALQAQPPQPNQSKCGSEADVGWYIGSVVGGVWVGWAGLKGFGGCGFGWLGSGSWVGRFGLGALGVEGGHALARSRVSTTQPNIPIPDCTANATAGGYDCVVNGQTVHVNATANVTQVCEG